MFLRLPFSFLSVSLCKYAKSNLISWSVGIEPASKQKPHVYINYEIDLMNGFIIYETKQLVLYLNKILRSFRSHGKKSPNFHKGYSINLSMAKPELLIAKCMINKTMRPLKVQNTKRK